MTYKDYYYISASLDVSTLIPSTPNTPFEYLLYFNSENTLAYLDSPSLEDYRQFHILDPRSTITDVAVYTNPPINQANFFANVGFQHIDILATPQLSNDPQSIVPEPYLNRIVTFLNDLEFINCALLDPNQLFIYFGTYGTIFKFNVATFAIQQVIKLNYWLFAKNLYVRFGVIDSTGAYAYFLVADGVVFKIDLDTFSQVATLDLFSTGVQRFEDRDGAFLIDPFNRYLYICGQNVFTAATQVLKIDLSTFTVSQTMTITIPFFRVFCAMIDNTGSFAYFSGTLGIARMDLSTLTITGFLTFASFSLYPVDATAAVIDSNSRYGYLIRKQVITKFDMTTVPTPTFILETLTGGTEISQPVSAVLQPNNQYMYISGVHVDGGGRLSIAKIFVPSTRLGVPAQIALVDVGTEAQDNRFFAMTYIDSIQTLIAASNPITCNQNSPTRVIQVTADSFNYQLSQDLPQSILRTNVAVCDPDGRYAYFGSANASFYVTGVKTPSVIQVDLTTFQVLIQTTLNTYTLESSVDIALMDPAGEYVYFVAARTGAPAALYKFAIPTFTPTDNLLFNSGEEKITTAVIDGQGVFAYFFVRPPSGPPPYNQLLVKYNVQTMTRVGVLTINTPAFTLSGALLSPDGQFLYCGDEQSAPQYTRIYKIDLSTFVYLGSTALTTDAYQNMIGCIDPQGQYAYYTGLSAPWITKYDLTSEPLPFLADATYQPSGNGAMIMHPSGKYLYSLRLLPLSATNNRLYVNIVNLETFQMSSQVEYLTTENVMSIEQALTFIDPQGRYMYWSTLSNPPTIFRMNLTNSVLSGFSTSSPANLQNTTEIVNIDFTNQVAKLQSTSQIQAWQQSRYLGLYIRGETGDLVDPGRPLIIHTRVKVYPTLF